MMIKGQFQIDKSTQMHDQTAIRTPYKVNSRYMSHSNPNYIGHTRSTQSSKVIHRQSQIQRSQGQITMHFLH